MRKCVSRSSLSLEFRGISQRVKSILLLWQKCRVTTGFEQSEDKTRGMYGQKHLSRRANALKRQLTHSLRRSAYPHQPYVDRFYVLPPRRCRPKLVLTGTSISLYWQSAHSASTYISKSSNISVYKQNERFPCL